MVSMLTKVLTPSPHHRLPSSSAKLLSSQKSWSRRTPPQSLHSWDSAGSFSNRRLSHSSTELIAHKSTPPCCLHVRLLLDHHELRLHIMQRSVRCQDRCIRNLPHNYGTWLTAVHVFHLDRWTRTRLVDHFCSQTLVVHKICCADSHMWTGLIAAQDLLSTQRSDSPVCIFLPSVDSRSCSLTRCLLDVANPLVTYLHHLNLVRWSCNSIASSTWFSTSFSVHYCFLLKFLLFLLRKLIPPAPISLCTTLQLGIFLLLRCDDDAQL